MARERAKITVEIIKVRRRAEDQLKSGNIGRGAPVPAGYSVDQYGRLREGGIKNPTTDQIDAQANFTGGSYYRKTKNFQNHLNSNGGLLKWFVDHWKETMIQESEEPVV